MPAPTDAYRCLPTPTYAYLRLPTPTNAYRRLRFAYGLTLPASRYRYGMASPTKFTRMPPSKFKDYQHVSQQVPLPVPVEASPPSPARPLRSTGSLRPQLRPSETLRLSCTVRRRLDPLPATGMVITSPSEFPSRYRYKYR
jgi:hypothetical protein